MYFWPKPEQKRQDQKHRPKTRHPSGGDLEKQHDHRRADEYTGETAGPSRPGAIQDGGGGEESQTSDRRDGAHQQNAAGQECQVTVPCNIESRIS